MISKQDILNARILIVDDNQTNISVLEQMLSTAGYTSVLGITDSRETLELFESFKPNLILLDIMMPELDGYQVMEQLKKLEHADYVPILVMTALQDKETCIKSLKSGAKDFLSKPFDFAEVLTRIRNMLEAGLLYNKVNGQNIMLEQKILENKEYKENLEAILKSISEAIITVDKDLVILHYNKAAEDICGLPGNNEANGKNYRSFTNNCKGKCLEAFTETIKTKLPAERSRIECNNQNMPGHVVSVVTYPLFDNREKFSGCVIVVRDETRLVELENNLNKRQQLENIIGESEKMQKVYHLIEALVNTQTTVLIMGENGTGKGLVAEALHYHRKDTKGPFVIVNCAALSENLLESELFGHVKGAYTGAVTDRVGRFQKADGGTVFLDEIGDISHTMQLRLLRVIQDMEFERVGDSTPIKVNVRIIAATNQDLRKKVRSGKFREDLFHRLKVVVITMPTLRERREDIPLLIAHFTKQLNRKLNKNIKSISEDVQRVFMDYKWPGNVRELQNTLESAFVMCNKPIITKDDLPADIETPFTGEVQHKGKKVLNDRDAIVQALEKTGWNKAKAARLLGIDRTTIYQKIKMFNIIERGDKIPP